MQKRKVNEILEKGKKMFCKVRRKLTDVAVTAYLSGVCFFGFAMTAYAAGGEANPSEKARTLAMNWLKPVVYIGLAVFGVRFLFKKRFTEFFTFAAISVVAVLFVFYPETVVNFLGTTVQSLFE